MCTGQLELLWKSIRDSMDLMAEVYFLIVLEVLIEVQDQDARKFDFHWGLPFQLRNMYTFPVDLLGLSSVCVGGEV